MSKKKKSTCLGCGKRLNAKWAACPRCRRVNMARVRKGAAGPGGPLLLTKSAAKFAAKTAGMVLCGRGHWNRPYGTCCTACGDLMPGVPVPPLQHVAKSAVAYNFWAREYGRDPDPGKREAFRNALYGQNGGTA